MKAEIVTTHDESLMLVIEPSTVAEKTLLLIFSKKVIRRGVRLANIESKPGESIISLSLVYDDKKEEPV